MKQFLKNRVLAKLNFSGAWENINNKKISLPYICTNLVYLALTLLWAPMRYPNRTLYPNLDIFKLKSFKILQ